MQARWYRKIIGKYLTIEVFGLKLAEHILLNLLYNLLVIHLVGSPAKSQTRKLRLMSPSSFRGGLISRRFLTAFLMKK